LKKFSVMAMPKRRPDSELLQEGCRSYHKALFAVLQFRRQAQEAIRAAVDERMDDIAAALKLDKAEISEGLTPYANPANFVQSWDGSDAEVGLRYPGKDWQTKWGIYFYFYIGEGEGGHVGAYCWIKEPGLAMKRLASLGVRGLETDESSAWILESVSEATGGFTDAMNRSLDGWIEVWRKVGGIQQFLPARKIHEGPAGK
jgi:hypothetical protein